MKLCLLFLLLAGPARADEILSLLRSQPYLQERILIREGDGGREELLINTNVLQLKRNTLGRLTRPATNLKAKAEALLAESPKLPSQPPNLARDLHNWKVFVKGSQIHPGDPRYDKAFDLILKQIEDSRWSLQEGATMTNRFPNLAVEREALEKTNGLTLKKTKRTETLSFFETCRITFAGKTGCQIPDFGVWFLEP